GRDEIELDLLDVLEVDAVSRAADAAGSTRIARRLRQTPVQSVVQVDQLIAQLFFQFDMPRCVRMASRMNGPSVRAFVSPMPRTRSSCGSVSGLWRDSSRMVLSSKMT